MKRGLLILGLIGIAGSAMATNTKGRTNVPETCFSDLLGNLPNKSLQNNNLVVAWGRGRDCLYFTPTSFEVAKNSPFKLGQLCWTNDNSRYETNGKLDVNLNVGVKFTNPNIGTQVFTMAIQYNEKNPGQDYVILPTSFTSKTVTVNDTVYTVKLKGFKQQGAGADSASVGRWEIPGGTTKCLDLWAEVEAQPVPEPATMAVLGFGALAALRRRKRK